MNLDKILSRVYKILKIIVLFMLLSMFVGMLKPKALTQKSGSLGLSAPYNSQCGSGGTGYCAINTSNVANLRQTGTSYSGVLVGLQFGFSYGSFNSAYTYTLNIEAMSTDFRNKNLAIYIYGWDGTHPSQQTALTTDFKFVSKSKITITIPSGVYYPAYAIYMSGSNLTGETNYGIKKVYLTWDDGQQDISGIINNQNQNTSDIINNNNSNTEDIINNNTSNTEDIINNQNQNTQDLIESSKCRTNYSYNAEDFFFENGYLDSNGNVVNDSSYMVSPFLNILSNRQYTITFGPARSGKYVCLYNGNKAKLNCYEMTSTITFTTGATQNQLLRVVAVKSSGAFVPVKISGPVCNDWQLIADNKSRDIENDTNNYLKDNSDPTIDNSGIQNAINNSKLSNPLSYFLTLPTTLLNTILDGLSSNSCTDFTIGHFGNIGRADLSGYTFKFPCIDIKSKLGNDLYNTIDVIVAVGIYVMTIWKLYKTVSSYITLGAEDEANSHSAFLSPMDFLGNLIAPDLSVRASLKSAGDNS